MKKFKPKKTRKITLTFAIIGFAIVVIGEYLYPNSILKIFGIVWIFTSVLFHIIFYRCPFFGSFLSRSTGKCCPNCGKNMDEDI